MAIVLVLPVESVSVELNAGRFTTKTPDPAPSRENPSPVYMHRNIILYLATQAEEKLTLQKQIQQKKCKCTKSLNSSRVIACSLEQSPISQSLAELSHVECTMPKEGVETSLT